MPGEARGFRNSEPSLPVVDASVKTALVVDPHRMALVGDLLSGFAGPNLPSRVHAFFAKLERVEGRLVVRATFDLRSAWSAGAANLLTLKSHHEGLRPHRPQRRAARGKATRSASGRPPLWRPGAASVHPSSRRRAPAIGSLRCSRVLATARNPSAAGRHPSSLSPRLTNAITTEITSTKPTNARPIAARF